MFAGRNCNISVVDAISVELLVLHVVDSWQYVSVLSDIPERTVLYVIYVALAAPRVGGQAVEQRRSGLPTSDEQVASVCEADR